MAGFMEIQGSEDVSVLRRMVLDSYSGEVTPQMAA